MTGQVFGHGQQVIANVPFEYVRFDEQPLWSRFAQELLRIGHARYCQIAGKGRLHR